MTKRWQEEKEERDRLREIEEEKDRKEEERALREEKRQDELVSYMQQATYALVYLSGMNNPPAE
jgi:hypothetical protein